jgi:phosphate-selective porin
MRIISRAVLAAVAATLLLPAHSASGNQDPIAQTEVAARKKHKKASAKKHADRPVLDVGPVSLEPAFRVESEMRAAAPEVGRDASAIDWSGRRIGVEGTAFKRFTFEVSRELSSPSPWRDAYVSAKVTREFAIQGGRFKLPFGRDELTSETHLDFVYRSLAARVLSPGRDTGVMAFGRLLNRRVHYEVGFFTRDGDNGRTSETEGGASATAARLVAVPFAARKDSILAALQIGVATEISRVDDRLGLRGQTVLGDGVFFDRVYVNGRRSRTGLEAAWSDGPFSVSAEYIAMSDQRTGMGFTGEDLSPVGASAWYLAGTWTVTGERKRGRIEPRRDLLRGGLGAVELAVRVETLRFGDVTYPGSSFGFPVPTKLAANSDRVTTLGVNWYWNRYLKLQGNVILEAVDDPQRSPAPAHDGRLRSSVLMLQFRF